MTFDPTTASRHAPAAPHEHMLRRGAHDTWARLAPRRKADRPRAGKLALPVQALQAFSLPLPHAPDIVFDTVATACQRDAVAQLLQVHGPRIEAASAGLADYLGEALADPLPAGAVWTPASGWARQAMADDGIDPVDAAALVGLGLACAGRPGSWAVRLHPATVLVEELAITQVVAIDADLARGGRARLHLHRAGQPPVACHREAPDGRWTVAAGDAGVRRLVTVGRQRRIPVLTAPWLPGPAQAAHPHDGCGPSTALTPAMDRVLRAGFAALARHAPHALPWVERVIAALVVQPPTPHGGPAGHGQADLPGVVPLAGPQAAIEVTTALVHAAARQYGQMLAGLGPLDDGSDRRLYGIPAIPHHQPLAGVLQAFHAMGNVMLLHDAVRRQGETDPEDAFHVAARWTDLQATLRALERPLHGHRALTVLGRSLYEPLERRLRAIGVLDA